MKVVENIFSPIRNVSESPVLTLLNMTINFPKKFACCLKNEILIKLQLYDKVKGYRLMH